MGEQRSDTAVNAGAAPRAAGAAPAVNECDDDDDDMTDPGQQNTEWRAMNECSTSGSPPSTDRARQPAGQT